MIRLLLGIIRFTLWMFVGFWYNLLFPLPPLLVYTYLLTMHRKIIEKMSVIEYARILR